MLSNKEKVYLLKLARRSIERVFEGKKGVEVPPKEYEGLFKKAGAFVTLHKQGYLRGCIGILEAIYPLYEVVQEVAVSAAFKDPRFPPLEKKELPLIDIEISVLSPLKKGSPEEVEVGVHGVYLVKGFARGVLLPQVPVEFGWDRETFLKQVCRKAGLPPDCYKDPDCELYLFTAEIFSEKDFAVD
jgi:AmmeMemoRadiSam system protein A